MYYNNLLYDLMLYIAQHFQYNSDWIIFFLYRNLGSFCIQP